MWLLLRRFATMALMTWAMGKAVQRWPRLAIVRRLLGIRRVY